MTFIRGYKRKGQFFLITTVLVAIIMFSISSNLNSYGNKEIKGISESQDPTTYYNVRKEIKEKLEERGSNPTLKEKEMNNFIEENLIKAGYRVEINSSTCVNVTYDSKRYLIEDRFC